MGRRPSLWPISSSPPCRSPTPGSGRAPQGSHTAFGGDCLQLAATCPPLRIVLQLWMPSRQMLQTAASGPLRESTPRACLDLSARHRQSGASSGWQSKSKTACDRRQEGHFRGCFGTAPSRHLQSLPPFCPASVISCLPRSMRLMKRLPPLCLSFLKRSSAPSASEQLGSTTRSRAGRTLRMNRPATALLGAHSRSRLSEPARAARPTSQRPTLCSHGWSRCSRSRIQCTLGGLRRA
mmetsp:Transcript_25153/g.95059  ORF Transcript_25153/g.95059 Transcript_25153/m.95059 type:complete len:237 (+) Transcript_25153:1841-2551(+)